MRIGLAFAPEAESSSDLPDPTKGTVLDDVGRKLSSYPFVQSVVVIPHVYLQRGGGFKNLRQLEAAFGVDVIGLVSFDQIANTSENPASILYITLVGRYFIPGDKHEVKTLVDVLLLEPQSETLLMRAAGTSSVKGLSADAFQRSRASELSRRGYEQAVPLLFAELDERLEELKDDVRSGRRKDVRVEVKAGHSAQGLGLGLAGSGADGPLEALGLLVLLGTVARSFRRRAGA
jgi:rhombotail lipoprotein